MDNGEKYYQVSWLRDDETTQHCRVIAKDIETAKMQAARFHEVPIQSMLADEIGFISKNTLHIISTGELAL